ncbi:MAG: dockerin type I repeat-containing protein [Clostridia bacterium]|nr:dockerin type I repeat-containing protein [Clostridia bacterium]
MKKMSKVLALVLTLAMIVGATLVTGVISTSADTEVTVWEGTIDMDFETKNTVAIINTDDTLTQAIRDDLALNGAAVSYTLTSPDSSFIGGGSGYTTWGFYDELTAATPDNYHEWWSDKGSDMNRATWTDAADLALMGLKVNLCLYSDGTGDQAHVGSIKLVAVHSGNAVPVTTQAPKPTVPQGFFDNKVQLWTGTFDMDYTTSNTMAMLKVDEMNDAIRNDIAANGPAAGYLVQADATYVSGDSGYASYCFYQETPDYLEAWADKGSGVTEAAWTDATQLALMGNKVQLALCCDTDGDVIHLNTLTIYVVRSGSFTVPSQSQTTPSASETTPSVTEPSASESTPVVTEPSASESTPVVDVVPGDANGDGSINMKDVLALRKLLADMPAGDIIEANADVNGDGSINMKDVLALRKELAK